MPNPQPVHLAGIPGVGVSLATNAQAQSGEALARQVANPIAPLILVPIDLIHAKGVGPDGKGSQTAFVVNPVIPFVSQRSFAPGLPGKELGLGCRTGIPDSLRRHCDRRQAPGRRRMMRRPDGREARGDIAVSESNPHPPARGVQTKDLTDAA